MNERPPRRLSSWKEISGYLGRDVRTVSRWAKDRGLPVRRVPGGKGRSVFALTDELDRWLASGEADLPPAGDQQPAAPDSRAFGGRDSALPLVIAVALAALVIVSLAWSGVIPPAGAVQNITARGDEIVAVDASRREVWRHPFSSRLLLGPDPSRVYVGDLDEDGRAEAVVGMGLTQGGRDEEMLICFTPEGRIRWSVRPQDRFTFGAGEYGAPWGTGAVLGFRQAGAARIAWTAHHHTWWPSLLLVLDADGHVISRFVNSGWLTALNVTADNKYLLAAGWSNAQDAAVLAVLDAFNVTGASPEEDGSLFQCHNCPPGRPVRYFVLPRPELSRILRYPHSSPDLNVFEGGTLEVRTYQNISGAPPGEIIYEFSRDFEPRRATASDWYWEWHRTLERDGRIDHPADACPDRRGFTVRQWDPQAGWTSTTVPSAGR